MAARHHFEKPLFAVEQGLRALAAFDVRVLAVPTHQIAGFVAQRHGPDQEPAKRSIGAAQPGFELARLPGFERLAPGIERFGQIVGVNRGLPSHRPASCRLMPV